MTKTHSRLAGILGAITIALVVGLALSERLEAQGLPPPYPAVYSGTATVGGSPVPDGLRIFARIGSYVSMPAIVKAGRYRLEVTPPDTSFIGQPITFLLEDIPADQKDEKFVSLRINLSFNLTFPRLPEPTPTPTPFVISPMVYSGNIVIAGGTVPPGATLVARVGDYESAPAIIEGQRYFNLVLLPEDESLVGQPVEFFLNGVKSAPPPAPQVFAPGESRTLDLVFFNVPVPSPTSTPVPPTPTNTPVPPTATPTPTRTPLPPTATPTATPVPPTPTSTPVPPTPTPRPTSTPAVPQPSPTPTPEVSGGGCGAPLGGSAGMAGLASFLLMVTPVAMLIGRRRLHR